MDHVADISPKYVRYRDEERPLVGSPRDINYHMQEVRVEARRFAVLQLAVFLYHSSLAQDLSLNLFNFKSFCIFLNALIHGQFHIPFTQFHFSFFLKSIVAYILHTKETIIHMLTLIAFPLPCYLFQCNFTVFKCNGYFLCPKLS